MCRKGVQGGQGVRECPNACVTPAHPSPPGTPGTTPGALPGALEGKAIAFVTGESLSEVVIVVCRHWQP